MSSSTPDKATGGRPRQWLPLIEKVALALALVLPLLLRGQPELVTLSTNILILALLAISFDLCWGVRSQVGMGTILPRSGSRTRRVCPRGYQAAWADENPVRPPYDFNFFFSPHGATFNNIPGTATAAHSRKQCMRAYFDLSCTRAASHTRISTGAPSSAVALKNATYPKVSTATPEKPAINFGSSTISELNSAYCVAE